MKYVSQKYCRGCHQVLARDAFPPHIDINTRCIACQQGRDTSPSHDTTAPQQVTIVRRGFTRRHSTDRRD